MIDPNDIHSDDDMDITTPSTTSTPITPTPTPTKKNKNKQQPKNKNQNRMPFLDTFYSLSCDDQQERSYAAYSLIQHIFLSTSSSSSSSQEQGETFLTTKEELLSRVKDGTYAFQRLLNGLNSGRESSRQGFGACLSLFLKYSLTIVPFVKEGDDDDDDDDENKQNDKCFMELFREYNDTHPTKGSAPVIPTTITSTTETKETIYHYIYTKIVAATTSTTSSETNLSKNMKKKKKGSEDRDYQFGLLFGICSMIRSGMIMDCGIEVIKLYTGELLQLYNTKKWMREPCIHALMELMSRLMTTTATNTNTADDGDDMEEDTNEEAKQDTGKIYVTILVNDLLHDFFPVKNLEIDNTTITSSSSETNSAHTNNSDTINDWTVEKVTLYLHLQTLFVDCLSNNQEDYDVQEIPSILHASILTLPISNNGIAVAAAPKTSTTTLNPNVIQLLTQTSKVVHPRCHIVWNVIINYLTTSATATTNNGSTNDTTSSSTLMKKVLRKNIPMIPNNNTSLSVSNILEGIVNDVILSSLLGYINTDTTNTTIPSTTTNTVTTPVIATHERRALAMLLLQKINNISNLPLLVVENVVWHSHLISNLFVHTLQNGSRGFIHNKNKAGKGKAGKGKEGKEVNNSDNKKVHYLEPLASHILNDIITSLVNTTSPSTSSDITPENTFENNNNMERRLALVRSLLKANPLFDKVTKTESISTLLSLDYNNTTATNINTSDSNDNDNDDRIQQEDNQNMILWEKHVTFLENQILAGIIATNNNNNTTPETAFNNDTSSSSSPSPSVYVSLLLEFVKRVLRVSNSNSTTNRKNNNNPGYKITKRVLEFLSILSFYDLNNNNKDIIIIEQQEQQEQQEEVVTNSGRKKKRKKKNSRNKTPETKINNLHSFVTTVHRIQKLLRSTKKTKEIQIPFHLREIMSSLLQSLLHDSSFILGSSSKNDCRSQMALELMTFLNDGRMALKGFGIVTHIDIMEDAIAAAAASSNNMVVDNNDSTMNEWNQSISNMNDLTTLLNVTIAQETKEDDSTKTSMSTLASVSSSLKIKTITSLCSLATSLHLQLLSIGVVTTTNDSIENNGQQHQQQQFDEDDDDNIKDEIYEIISDLPIIAKDLLFVIDNNRLPPPLPKEEDSDDDDDDEEDDIINNPLLSLANVCVSLLNSSIGGVTTNPSRLGGTKLVKDCVIKAWTMSVSMLTQHEKINRSGGGSGSGDKDEVVVVTSMKSLIDEDVTTLLLESVCGSKIMDSLEEVVVDSSSSTTTTNRNSSMDEDEKDNDDDDENDMVNSSDDESQGSASLFTAANSNKLNLEGDDDDDNDSDNDSDDDDDNTPKKTKSNDDNNKKEDDLELDPSALGNILLEDSDVDDENEKEDDDFQLEHHAGADSALLQLIRVQRDARKTGRDEQKRIELSNQLRSIVLLETIFSKPPPMSNNIVLTSVLPLLRKRKELDRIADRAKSVSKLGENRALRDKITFILMNSKWIGCCTSVSNMEDELCTVVGLAILKEGKSSPNTVHTKCCNTALFRMVLSTWQSAGEEVSIKLARTLYVAAVEEWAVKKGTGLHSSMFDDLIVKCPK